MMQNLFKKVKLIYTFCCAQMLQFGFSFPFYSGNNSIQEKLIIRLPAAQSQTTVQFDVDRMKREQKAWFIKNNKLFGCLFCFFCVEAPMQTKR